MSVLAKESTVSIKPPIFMNNNAKNASRGCRYGPFITLCKVEPLHALWQEERVVSLVW